MRALEWQVPVVAISLYRNPEDDPELGRHLLGTQYVQPLLPDRASWFDDHVLRICIASAGEAAEMRYRRGRRAELAEWEVDDIENAARFDRQTVRRCLQYIPTTDHNHVIATQIREVDEWIERPDTWRVVQTVAREKIAKIEAPNKPAAPVRTEAEQLEARRKNVSVVSRAARMPMARTIED